MPLCGLRLFLIHRFVLCPVARGYENNPRMGMKGDVMAKYGPKAKEKVGKAVHEQKKGTLKTGSGKKVTSRKQAVAIGLDQARRTGGKVPPKKSSSKGK
jgi:hypothetical protein